MRDADAAPEAGVQNRLLVALVLDLNRSDIVDQVDRPVQRIAVEPVLKSGRCPARQDRWADEAVRARDRLAVRVKACGNPVVIVLSVDVVLDLFLSVMTQ